MNDETKTCPFCAETIKDAATYCRFCKHDLSPNRMAPAAPGSSPVAARAETTYLNNSLAIITSTRAMMNGKTYAMANISSVAMFKQSPNYTPSLVAGIVIALLCAIFSPVLGIIAFVISIVVAILLKPTYHVRIGSASGESNILGTESEDDIRAIVTAMNTAIVNRG